jgi:hypothetical protein
LTIWDQLFHRAVFPTRETVGIDTGLPGRPLIVEQAGARPQHLKVLAGQLAAPFRPLERAVRPSGRALSTDWSQIGVMQTEPDDAGATRAWIDVRAAEVA